MMNTDGVYSEIENPVFCRHQKVFNSDEKNIKKAVSIIQNGGIAILPADTVYGIFGRADDQKVVERVYSLKRRDRRKPFVIYTNHEKVDGVAYINDTADKLIKEVWPKALSLILPKKPCVSDWFTDNIQTVAVLMATNKIVSSVVENVNGLVFGTTVNISGEPELKTADSVYPFLDDVDIVIADDSVPIYNKPSTMVNCTTEPPRITRHSSLRIEYLRHFIPNLSIDLGSAI